MRVLMLCLAMATPAVGQVYGPPAPQAPRPPVVDSRGPAPGTWRDIRDVRTQIDHGRDTGALTRREARRYRREADQIGVLADRYGMGGVSASEQQELDNRARVLRDQVNVRRLQRATARR